MSVFKHLVFSVEIMLLCVRRHPTSWNLTSTHSMIPLQYLYGAFADDDAGGPSCCRRLVRVRCLKTRCNGPGLFCTIWYVWIPNSLTNWERAPVLTLGRLPDDYNFPSALAIARQITHIIHSKRPCRRANPRPDRQSGWCHFYTS